MRIRRLPSLASLWLTCGLLLASTATLAGTDINTWPVAPSVLQMPTPYGTLHIATTEYVYESRLMLDNAPVEPAIQGLLNLTYAFAQTRRHAVLVSIDSGDNRCPFTYRWLLLDKAGYRISPPLGSCSDKIRVSATKTLFTVETPSQDQPGSIDVHVYDGTFLRRHSTAPRTKETP